MSANISELKSKLKPCPFCGRKPKLYEIPPHTHQIATFMPDFAGEWICECVICGQALIEGKTAEEAAKNWNRRAPEWVSTKKAVPVDGNECLIVTAGRLGLARYSLTGKWKMKSCEIGCEVTHWRDISKDWISVSEKLPEEKGRYLVLQSNYGYCFADYYGDGEWMEQDLCNITRFVTHWQLLPDKPTMED